MEGHPKPMLLLSFDEILKSAFIEFDILFWLRTDFFIESIFLIMI